MSVHFDYPSIRDFFEIHGNTSCEKLNDYEHCRAESDRLYNEQLKESEEEIPTENQEKTDT
ncbi:hypothetical protein [Pedobacter sp. UBA5917]|jgi:hypothetical protein|uniref:hypothetical protein n=1 Tax=Pedobacter sp. UBA5917 TaxID=1947061 RepID=UPI0025E840FA|nr:hypothetical protein [Pedobacter sp. UBA5917]